MQWLRTLGPWVHDHEALTMEFFWKGKRVCFSGNLVSNPDTVTYNQFCAFLHTEAINQVYTLDAVGPFACSSIVPSWVDLSSNCATLPTANKQLLGQYEAVFQTLSTLPPFRTVDHHIHL